MKHEKWHIVFALVAGAALAIAPAAAIGVIASRGEMRTDLYMWLVLVPVGIFVFARGLQFILQNRKYDMLHKFGQRLTAKYVSHGTKQGERAPMYYVRYSFVADGKEILATSPSLYSWEEALAFRAAGEFTVLYKNGSYMIGEDAKALFERYFEKVNDLKRAYNEAFNAVYADLIKEAEEKQRKKEEKYSDDYGEESEKESANEGGERKESEKPESAEGGERKEGEKSETFEDGAEKEGAERKDGELPVDGE